MDPKKINDLIQDINFPISKDELAARAREHGMPDMVIDKIHNMERDIINNPGDLAKEIGNFVM